MINWRNKENIELVFVRRWTYMICPVKDIYPSGNGAIIKIQRPCFKDVKIKGGTHVTEPYYVQNAYYVLDEPGEWNLDKVKNEIHYIPKKDETMERIEAIIPGIEIILEVKGTLDKPVRNLHFEQSCSPRNADSL